MLAFVCFVSMPRTAIVRKTVKIGRGGDIEDSGRSVNGWRSIYVVRDATLVAIVYLLIPTLFNGNHYTIRSQS